MNDQLPNNTVSATQLQVPLQPWTQIAEYDLLMEPVIHMSIDPLIEKDPSLQLQVLRPNFMHMLVHLLYVSRGSRPPAGCKLETSNSQPDLIYDSSW